MRILANRIVISLLLILGGTAYWEFKLPPASRPLYSAAVSNYQQRHYGRSLAELREDLKFEPNDPSLLTLMGWDALKMHQVSSASTYFRQAHRFAPGNSGALLGEIYAEIALQNYGAAKRLLNESHRRYGETVAFKTARDTLIANVAPSNSLPDQGLSLDAGSHFVTPSNNAGLQPSSSSR